MSWGIRSSRFDKRLSRTFGRGLFQVMVQRVPSLKISGNLVEPPLNIDSDRGNFKLLGLIYWLYLRNFELFGGRVVEEES